MLPDQGRKRQTLNTKDHFWLVTGKNKPAVDNWFRDLGQNQKPLNWLAKKVTSGLLHIGIYIASSSLHF